MAGATLYTVINTSQCQQSDSKIIGLTSDVKGLICFDNTMVIELFRSLLIESSVILGYSRFIGRNSKFLLHNYNQGSLSQFLFTRVIRSNAFYHVDVLWFH